MTRRLVECRAGDRLLVGAVDGSAARIDKLASLGVLPGVELRVQQTRPVVVVECDETRAGARAQRRGGHRSGPVRRRALRGRRVERGDRG